MYMVTIGQPCMLTNYKYQDTNHFFLAFFSNGGVGLHGIRGREDRHTAQRSVCWLSAAVPGRCDTCQVLSSEMSSPPNPSYHQNHWSEFQQSYLQIFKINLFPLHFQRIKIQKYFHTKNPKKHLGKESHILNTEKDKQ